MADSDDITHQQILDKIDSSNQQLLTALSQQLGTITDNMMTKKDVQEVVRYELKGYATKDDLKAFATKDDLKAFATKDDLKAVRVEVADIRDEQLRQGVQLDDIQDSVQKIAESVSNEFKLKQRVDGHGKRIKVLETTGKVVRSTVTHHSRQIKTLQTARS